MSRVSLSREAAETILEALGRAEKATTPDGEFVYCPVCMKMSWLGHEPSCLLIQAKDLLDAALRSS